MTGISKMPMMNDFVLTAALYSRAAMTRTLRMRLYLLMLFRLRDADKNIVQRRVSHLEMLDAAALHERGEQPLRVGLPFQTQLLPAAQVAHVHDTRQAGPGRAAVFQAH